MTPIAESLCTVEGREMRIFQIFNCIFMCFVVSSLSFDFGEQMSENELKLRICLTTRWNFNFLNVKITLGLPNNLICEVVPK